MFFYCGTDSIKDLGFGRFVVFIRDHERDAGILASADILDEARQEAQEVCERLENEEGGADTRYVVVADQMGVEPEEYVIPRGFCLLPGVKGGLTKGGVRIARRADK